MEKRKLSLDMLQVESFATDAQGDGRGTVEGHQISEPFVCYTNEFCGCNDGVSNISCRATCYAGSGCGGGSGHFSCNPAQSCNPADTCGGCTAYLMEC